MFIEGALPLHSLGPLLQSFAQIISDILCYQSDMWETSGSRRQELWAVWKMGNTQRKQSSGRQHREKQNEPSSWASPHTLHEEGWAERWMRAGNSMARQLRRNGGGIQGPGRISNLAEALYEWLGINYILKSLHLSPQQLDKYRLKLKGSSVTTKPRPSICLHS